MCSSNELRSLWVCLVELLDGAAINSPPCVGCAARGGVRAEQSRAEKKKKKKKKKKNNKRSCDHVKDLLSAAEPPETMTTHFSIDDAFVLDGEEEEEEVKEEVVVAAAAAAAAVAVVSDGESREGWNKGREKDRDAAGEMTFGPLSFTKPQSHPSPATAGSLDHSNLKYQNLENEDVLGSSIVIQLNPDA
ncbi:hypothetical protein CRUP_020552, partial [Coryphaenoides rupestris]